MVAGSSSSSSSSSSSYWDCPEHGEEEEDENGAFATPLDTKVLRRTSSAFSLGARSLTGSPIRAALFPPPQQQQQAPQEEEEEATRGGGGDDGSGDRDMHEVVCAAERLSEAAILMRFSGLRAVGAGGDSSSSSLSNGGGGADAPPAIPQQLLCRHLAIVALRPDAQGGALTTLLVGVAQARGLLISKRQGPHVVADAPAACPHRWEWRAVDMQLAVDRQTRDRVLLVRFLLAAAGGEGGAAAGSGGEGGEGAASAEARRRRPATRAFLDALKARLLEAGFNKHGGWVGWWGGV